MSTDHVEFIGRAEVQMERIIDRQVEAHPYYLAGRASRDPEVADLNRIIDNLSGCPQLLEQREALIRQLVVALISLQYITQEDHPRTMAALAAAKEQGFEP